MSRVRLLERDEAPIHARSIYADDGSASPLKRSLANAPDLLETLLPFLGQIFDEGAVDLATKELVVVRVSQLNSCRYCLAAHRPLALESGVPPAQIAAVCDELPTLGDLPDRERTIIEWTDRYVADPHEIDDDLAARILDHVRDDQLIELSILIGATQLLNQYCSAFDVPPRA
ncbi:MAG: carboxymuconolactone decarboxylase family protein [Gaiellaceae bacterium]